jgi:predicted dinucleotide-binding enzyme
MTIKKIGILGSGIVGQTLAIGFLKHGYDVMVGTRTPEKLASWKKAEGSGAAVGSFEDTARFGEILVLAVKGKAAVNVMRNAGLKNHAGKITIDTTNPIEDTSPENGVLKFFTTLDRSLMEQLQDAFPETNFVKAFSCIGSHLMVNPDFNGEKPSMFICGNSASAKQEISNILEKLGFQVEDMGGATGARAIEPLCMLWCIPGLLNNQWDHAFRLLKK